MACSRIVFRTGSCKDRATKFTWTTRGRRWARSRKSSWRSRCAEIASATSSRAWYRSASVSQGDEECLSIDTQYGLSARDGSRAFSSSYSRGRFRWMLKRPLLYDVQPAVSPGESTDYFSISSEYQRQLPAASSLWEAKNGIISHFRVRSPA